MKSDCKIRHCDCFYEDSGKCTSCTYNKNTISEHQEDSYISNLDKVTELYEFLTGIAIPKDILAKSPKLSRKKAFTVIWFLQEQTHCLPDYIEQCRECGGLYDSEREGYCLDDQYDLNGKELPKKYWGCFCNNCVPAVDFVLG